MLLLDSSSGPSDAVDVVMAVSSHIPFCFFFDSFPWAIGYTELAAVMIVGNVMVGRDVAAAL